MGYGTRALQMLREYYEQKHCTVDEDDAGENLALRNVYVRSFAVFCMQL